MELRLERPEALALLALPLLLLAVARLTARPAPAPTGSLRLWRALAQRSAGARGARGRVPPAVVALAAALALAALAFAGPALASPAPGRLFVALVDRSPAMHLPVGPRQAGSGAGTRLDAALELARGHLARSAGPRDRVRWESPGREDLVLPAGESPPAAWLAPDGRPAELPVFEARDVPGALWITDRPRPASAATVAAGGGADAPGPVGERGGALLVWEGGGRVTERAAPPRRALLVARDGEPHALWADLLAAWCAERGLELAAAERAGEADLVVLLPEPAPAGAARAVVGRDGWSLEAELCDAPDLGRAEARTWLAGPPPDVAPLVRWAPGAVALGLAPLAEPAGDPAAFALSWGSLLDGALPPRAGVVPLADRRAAGEPRLSAGAPPEAGGGPERAAPPLPALLAALAGAAALAAAWLGRGRG